MRDQTDNPAQPADDDSLAAEYVLGVLDAAERESCARRIEQDSAFAALVVQWQERLASMNETYEEVTPPAAIKSAIDGRLFGSEAANSPLGEVLEQAQRGLWQRFGGWISAAVAVLVLAIGVGLWSGVLLPTDKGPVLVAELAPTEGRASFDARFEQQSGQLRITFKNGVPGAEKDFELWVIEEGQSPVSLGVLPQNVASSDLDLSEPLAAKLTRGAVLAVSLEPKNGSPTGLPTGPVVALGPLKDALQS